MALEPGRLIGHHRVANRVGLVEGVVGKVVDLVVDALGHVLGDAVGGTPGDVPLRVPVEEGGPLLLDVLHLFLGHGPAHHIRLAQGVAPQLLEDLDDLLLVDNAAVGVGQDGNEGGVLIGDLLRVVLAGDEPGNGLHRPRPVQSDNGGDVLDVLGLQAHTHTGHAGGLHLEHAGGLAVGQHLEHRRIVVGDLLRVEVRVAAADQLGRVVQHRQVSKAQEVHL